MRHLLLAAALSACVSCSSISGGGTSALHCPSDATPRVSESGTWCETPTGESVGVALAWYGPGRLQSASQLQRNEAVATVFFYETGEIESVRSAVPGTTREISRHWYRDGTQKIYSEWEHGQLNGLYRSWQSNGKPESEGRFLEGEHVGTWRFWDPEDGAERTVEYSSAEKSPDVPAAPGP